MKSKNRVLFPKYQNVLDVRIKLARKRRKVITIQVAERASIDRTTLYQIEKGNLSVSMGSCFNALRFLNLQDDFLKLASE
jgi:DNA-binding XRE family transcriptional regulator